MGRKYNQTSCVYRDDHQTFTEIVIWAMLFLAVPTTASICLGDEVEVNASTKEAVAILTKGGHTITIEIADNLAVSHVSLKGGGDSSVLSAIREIPPVASLILTKFKVGKDELGTVRKPRFDFYRPTSNA